jgi:hypothetical protein
MTLLEFARGPGLQWSITIFIVGVLWRLLGIFLLRSKKDLSEPRNPAAWKGLRLIALRSWPRREFLGGTAFGEVMGYAFHIGFLLTLFFYVPHVLFFADVSRGLIGTDLQGLTRFAWPTLQNIVTARRDLDRRTGGSSDPPDRQSGKAADLQLRRLLQLVRHGDAARDGSRRVCARRRLAL